ncbi:MAG: 3-oxoacid CoA-transferase subunit B [Eubacterium sp.]|nr:3-oxoacid CoA-transferase subunit B [Eubacterium sp.]
MADIKERIARRVAKEMHDGDIANLGIGLPTLVAKYIPEDIIVTLHSENGFAGLDETWPVNDPGIDVDIIDSGGTYVKALPRVKYFDTSESFGIVRGGHLDATVLGAMQVAENGDLANWIIPGKKVAGMGGAMDLVVGAKKVIIAMTHTQKGNHKILEKCTLPLTAEKVVDMIVTEMGVMEVRPEGLVVTELHPDYTKEDIQAATGCKLIFADDLKPMEEE